jgi:hypothetical protein
LTKALKTYIDKKDSLFNRWCWENQISTCRRQKLDPCLSSCRKISPKWLKDLYIQKLPEENVGESLTIKAQQGLLP